MADLNTVTPRGDASILTKWASYIEQAAKDFKVNPFVLGAIILHESTGKPGVVNPTSGASGLTQVLPSANPKYNVSLLRGTSAEAIQYQIRAGAEILSNFLKQNNGDYTKALQGYAGTGYRSSTGQTFADELSQSYITPVMNALIGPIANVGNPIANAGEGVQNIVSDAVPGLQGFMSMLSNPATYVRIALFIIGGIVLIGGFYISAKEFSDG